MQNLSLSRTQRARPALYRDKNELIEWEARDPIPQYEFFLEKKGPT